MNSNELHSVESNESIFRMKFAQAASTSDGIVYDSSRDSFLVDHVCNFGSYDGDR